MKFRDFLFIGVFCLLSLCSFATHFSSGEIYYQWAPTPTDSNRYEITVIWYRSTGGINIYYPTQTVCLTSSCYPDTNVDLLRLSPPPNLQSPNDPQYWIVNDDGCGDYNDPNYNFLEAAIYREFVSLPGTCADFRFSISAPCCRDVATNLATIPNIYLEARLNNTLGPSSSPLFISSPGVSLCVRPTGHPPTQFYQNAIDLDGDSITYTLAPSLTGTSNCGSPTAIAYQAGYTANDPISSTTPTTIDQLSGGISLSPDQQGEYAVRIIVNNLRFDPISLSWFNVGESMRELLIPVTANCNPSTLGIMGSGFTLFDSTYIERNFTSLQVDSLQNSYQVSQILRDTNNGSVLPQLQDLACGETQVHLNFEGYFNSATFTPTDFRLYSPDSTNIPIVGLSFQDTLPGSPMIGALNIHLNNGLMINGNYLLQIRVGNDNNTFINQCGTEVSEFTSVLVPVSGCSGVGLNEWPLSWSVSNLISKDPSKPYAFQIITPDHEAEFTLEVFNQTGQLVHRDNHFSQRDSWKGDGLNSGLYIYQLVAKIEGREIRKRGRLIITN